jgi:hypothetical protein
MRQHLRRGRIVAAALGFAGAACSSQSWASTIISPVTAVATSQFISSSGNDYSIGNTIDQSGLSLPSFISGLTDFDSYLASKPTHTSNANGNEWFSQDFGNASQNLSSRNVGQNLQSGITKNRLFKQNQNVSDFGSASGKRSAGKANKKSMVRKSSTSSANGKLGAIRSANGKLGAIRSANGNPGAISTAIGNPGAISTAIGNPGAISSAPLVSITYGFSGPIAINGFVLWNEEFAGIGTTQLLSSIDGTAYTLLSTITPEPSMFAPTGKVVPYLAQVFSFDLTTMLFFKLLIYDCPGPPANQSSYRGCGIGEVAFSSIPREPGEISPVVPLPAALPLLGSALGFFVWLGRRRKSCN